MTKQHTFFFYTMTEKLKTKYIKEDVVACMSLMYSPDIEPQNAIHNH